MLTSILIVSVIILIVLVLLMTESNKGYKILDAKIQRNYDDQSRLAKHLNNQFSCRQEEILKNIQSLRDNKWITGSIAEAQHVHSFKPSTEINDVRKELRDLKNDFFMEKNGISKFSCFKCSKELGVFNISDAAKHKAALFCSLECCKK